MAKTPTVNTITSGYASQTQLNENFTNIQAAFENTLSLDGSTPNAMGADLDLNNNDILNIGSFQANTITIGGSSVDLTDIQALTGIATDIQTLADIEDGTDATDAIQTVAGISSSVVSLSPISSDISTVAGISSDVTSVAGNATNINTVAGINADVTTVSGISADVSTVAADGTDIGVVAGLTTEVQALGPIASDITTVSGISSAVTTVSGINADVTTVAGVSSGVSTLSPISADITSVASISADVTSVANISSDISAINAQLSDLQTVADDLNEATSEIETVAASITNVDLVGTNITNVNTVANNLTDINNFFSVYRTGTTDPTTSLDTGDIFYNTATGTLKVYNGTAWEQGVVAGSGFLAQASNLSDLTDAAQARINLGVEIGVDVQAYDATLLNDADIGVTVQGYDATLLNDADIGVNVQAYDAQLADVAGLTPTVTHAIVGDGANFISTGSSTDAMQMPAGTDAERPSSPANGMIRYSTTSGSFEGYQAGAWSAIGGGGDVGAPTLSGSSSGNEFSDTTVTITDYDSNLIYRVSVTGGSYTRTGGTITWTLPSVTTDTIHYMTVNAIDNGVTSPDADWDIDVLNVAFTGDTGIQITNFASNTSNTGWAV